MTDETQSIKLSTSMLRCRWRAIHPNSKRKSGRFPRRFCNAGSIHGWANEWTVYFSNIPGSYKRIYYYQCKLNPCGLMSPLNHGPGTCLVLLDSSLSTRYSRCQFRKDFVGLAWKFHEECENYDRPACVYLRWRSFSFARKTMKETGVRGSNNSRRSSSKWYQRGLKLFKVKLDSRSVGEVISTFFERWMRAWIRVSVRRKYGPIV